MGNDWKDKANKIVIGAMKAVAVPVVAASIAVTVIITSKATKTPITIVSMPMYVACTVQGVL